MLVHKPNSPLMRFIDGWQAKALLCVISAALLLAVDLCPCGISQVIREIKVALRGTVTDAYGQPLAGVAVNDYDLERDLEGGTITNAKGQYQVHTAFSGPFLIEAKLKGFKRWVREGIVLDNDEAQQLDIVLVAEGSAPGRQTEAGRLY
jgi:hypothetical protein